MSWEDILKISYDPPKKEAYESDSQYEQRLKRYDAEYKRKKAAGAIENPKVTAERKEKQDAQRKKDHTYLQTKIDFHKAAQVMQWLSDKVKERFTPMRTGRDGRPNKAEIDHQKMLQNIFVNQANSVLMKLAKIGHPVFDKDSGGIKEWNTARRKMVQVLIDPRYVGLLNNLRIWRTVHGATPEEAIENWLELNGFGDGSE